AGRVARASVRAWRARPPPTAWAGRVPPRRSRSPRGSRGSALAHAALRGASRAAADHRDRTRRAAAGDTLAAVASSRRRGPGPTRPARRHGCRERTARDLLDRENGKRKAGTTATGRTWERTRAVPS